MSTPNRPEMTDRQVAKGDYVEIVDTSDEWESLIGIVEDFYDDQGQSCPVTHKEAVALVRIPTTKRGQVTLRLQDVNFLTSFVRQELNLHDELRIFPLKNVEWFDPNDL